MFHSPLVLRRNQIAMDRREELGLLALADLETAATAWLACSTIRELFVSQPEGGSVDPERYRRVALSLGDDFDRSAAAFRRSDAALRSEEVRRFGHSELPDPQSLVYVITVADEHGVSPDLFQDFARRLAGAPTLALLDRRGLEWMLRFLAMIGSDVGGVVVKGMARSYAAASAAQMVLLRSIFVTLEGDNASTERRLTAFIEARYEIPNLEALDELTAWKAIMRLRETVAALRLEVA